MIACWKQIKLQDFELLILNVSIGIRKVLEKYWKGIESIEKRNTSQIKIQDTRH